ncbi:MAG: hypothetical protein ACLT76_10645 [Clostridium fessum]
MTGSSRRDPCAISCGSPMARQHMGRIYKDPEVQADPLEPQMPSMSSR